MPIGFAEAEALLTRIRIEQGVPVVPITAEDYCAIHAHIFQDLYRWAGQYRTANVRHPKHDAFFCKTEYIADQMAEVFAKLRALPSPLDTPDHFAAVIAAPEVARGGIAQARRGRLALRNRAESGLSAELRLPRRDTRNVS